MSGTRPDVRLFPADLIGRLAARREGDIHGGSPAVWIRRRLVEVDVSIDEQQAEPAAPFEREHAG